MELIKFYLLRIELLSSFRHHLGDDFFKHFDISKGIGPKSLNHIDLDILSEKVLKIFDEDFDDFGFKIGNFLLC